MVSIPTIEQLYDSYIANLQNEFAVIIDEDGKAFLRGFAAVQAAKTWLQYLAAGDVQKNIWPDLSDPEAQGGTLERFGRTKGLNPFPGTQGVYLVQLVGSNGATLNASTVYKSDDSSSNPGYLFVLDNAFTLDGVSADNRVNLRALTTGTIALLKVGDTLTCTQPLANVNVIVIVLSITTSPVDAETTEQYRSRILETYILEPQGGAPADYRLWGREAAGVAQIYPYAVSGQVDTIAAYVEAIPSDSTDGKGTPTTTILDAVTAIYAPANGLKPLGVMPIQVSPVTIKTIAITFAGTAGSPGITAAQQTIVTASLIEAIALIRPFIAGAGAIADRNDTLSVNNIIQVALNAVTGIYFTGATMTVDSVSETTYTFDNGEIPWLNPAVSYT